MTNTLIHGIIDALSGSVSKEVIVFLISDDPDPGTSWCTSGCGTDPRGKGVNSDSTLHYRKYYSGSIYSASDHTGI